MTGCSCGMGWRRRRKRGEVDDGAAKVLQDEQPPSVLGSDSSAMSRQMTWRFAYKMECVKMSVVLSMDKLLSNGSLRAARELLSPSWEVAVHFVSHEWLGWSHPDPECIQLRRLQEIFSIFAAGEANSMFRDEEWQNFLQNSSTGTARVMQQFEAGLSKIAARSCDSVTRDVSEGLVWIDFCSIPQLCDVTDERDAARQRSDQLDAIRSIPAYVERADYFWVLAPTAMHRDTGVNRNFCSWRSRGWCRLEDWCNFLAMRRKMPLIITDTPKLATVGMLDHLVANIGRVDKAVCSGEFTCCRLGHPVGQCDKIYVTEVLKLLFTKRLEVLRAEGTFFGLFAALEHTLFANSSEQLEGPSSAETIEAFCHRLNCEDVYSVPGVRGSPFLCAMLTAHSEILKKMAQLVPELVTQPNVVGITPLMVGVFRPDLRELITAGIGLESHASVNAGSQSGITALHRACVNGFSVSAQVLLEHSASVDARRQDGKTPLLLAAGAGYLDCVKVLLQWRADPRALDSMCNNALHLAADSIALVGNADESERLQVVEMLVESMVNPEACNDEDMSPIDIGQRVRFHAGVALLRWHSAIRHVALENLQRPCQ